MAKRRAWTKTRSVTLGRKLRAASKSISPEQKAIYHHETGAGRSRVRRRFFEIGDEDETAIAALVEAGLARKYGAR